MSAAIEVEGLSHVYGGTVPALEDISLRVPAGRYAAVSRQLQAWAAARPTGAAAYDVQIRRAAASAQLALTCP